MATSGVDLFPATELSLDLDPCSECLHCGFLSYSTKHFENHITNSHRGVEIRTQKKIISLLVSAKVRQADASFFSSNSKNTSAKSSSMQGPSDDSGDIKPPALLNAPVSENCEDFKDMSLNFILNQMTFRPNTFEPSKEGAIEYAKYLSRELMSLYQPDVKKEMNIATNWTPKIETMYCLSCPFNNVHLENLKCHVFTLHAGTVAVARNCSTVSDVTPDVNAMWVFFCVKETCNHISDQFTTYEKHLMACCPSSQKFSEEEVQRLNSTLSFLLYFHKSGIVRAAPRFRKYISLFRKNFEGSISNSQMNNELIKEIIQRNLNTLHHSGSVNEEAESAAGRAVRRSRRQNQRVLYNDQADNTDSDGDEYRAVPDEEISDESD